MEILIAVLAVKIFVVFNIIMGLASFCTWVERKGSALIQDRIGANRAGAFLPEIKLQTDNLLLKPVFFILQFFVINVVMFGIWVAGVLGIINTLLCDAIKALFKEDFVPEGTSNFIHCLGPFMAVFPVFLAYALIPVAPDFQFPQLDESSFIGQIYGSIFGGLYGQTIRMQVASLNAGVLFILAMGSIAVYGVIIAGWTGNNKFSLLGALRASAQMISYELALGICFVTMIVTYGTLDLYEMISAQSGGSWGLWSSPTAWLTFIIFFIVGMAETKRGPFDLPESESELVAGYFTEYSGMKFLLFWLGEFAEIALFAILLTVLFFGGWDIFVQLPENSWWAALIGHGVLMGKVVILCVLQIVIRWTLPRFRYDQLMNLGWKMLLPLSLVNLMLTAAFKLWGIV